MSIPAKDALEAALDVVRTTPELDNLDKVLTSPTGRPRVVWPRHVIIGLLLCLLRDTTPYLKNAYSQLCDLRLEQRKAIGFGQYRQQPDGRKEWTNPTQNTFYGCFQAIRERLEISPRFAASSGFTLSEAEAERNKRFLQHVLDRLVDASIPEQYLGDGNYAIDSSRMPAFGNPPRRRHPDRQPADPDAYFMTKENSKGEKTRVYGNYVHTATAFPPRGTDLHGPSLIYGFEIDTRHGMAADGCVELLTRMSERYDIKRVNVDREYSNALPERFRWPLDELGIEPNFDLRPEDVGPRGIDPDTGSAIIEGRLFCGALPDNLADIGAPPPDDDHPDYEGYRKKFERRERFAHVQHQAPKPDGTGMRAMCPAEAGKVKCPRKPHSLSAGNDAPTVTDPLTDDVPPCTQKTFSIDLGVLGKRRQQPPAGSPEWYDIYKPGRAASERAFSLLNPSHAALSKKGPWRVHGITARAFYVATLIVAMNIHQVHTWRNGGEETTRRRRQSRRRTRNHSELIAGEPAPAKRTAEGRQPP